MDEREIAMEETKEARGLWYYLLLTPGVIAAGVLLAYLVYRLLNRLGY